MLTSAKLAIRVILGTQGCWKSEQLPSGESDFLFSLLGEKFMLANWLVPHHSAFGSCITVLTSLAKTMLKGLHCYFSSSSFS